MFIAIDGTSSSLSYEESASEYDAVYRNSYIKRLYRLSNEENKRYFRGPNILSFLRGSAASIRLQILAYIEQIVTQPHNQDTTIILAGYSRGAAICISIAKEIQRMQAITEYGIWARDLRISNIILLDAVDRAFLYTDVIPGNVARVFHAIRHPDTHSRECFGNTGLQFESATTERTVQYFRTSHAGVGGVINGHEYGGVAAAPEDDYETNYTELALEIIIGGIEAGPIGVAEAVGEEALTVLLAQIIECASSVDTHTLSRYEDEYGSAEVWHWIETHIIPIIRNPDSSAEVSATSGASATASISAPLTPAQRLGINSVPPISPLEFAGDDYLALAPGVLTGTTARTGGIREITGGRLRHQGGASQFEIYGKIKVMPRDIHETRIYFPRFERRLRTGSRVRLRFFLRTTGSDSPQEVTINLSGFQRAHIWGPGFGDEAKDGIMYAPTAVNQIFQNHGVESAIRRMANVLATEEYQNSVWVRAIATSFPTNLMHGLRVNYPNETELLLRTAVYHIGISAQNSETHIVPYCRIEIEVPHPRDASQEIGVNVIPLEASRLININEFFAQ